MLFKVDIDNTPMLYIEADDLATLEQIISTCPSIKQGLKLNSISPIEDKCYIKKEQDVMGYNHYKGDIE